MSKKSKEGSYGFVYLWRDKAYNRFYIGSHWGFETDRYICSSNSMRDAYRRRKTDFKRRILQKVYTDRKELLEVEQRWIDKIKPEEFGRRYYNVNAKVGQYAWWMNEDTKAEVSEKLRNAKLGKPKAGNPENWKHSEEQKRKWSEMRKGKPLWPNGRVFTEETRKKMSESQKGRIPVNKGMKTGKPSWNRGITPNEETRKKMSEMKTGIKWFHNPLTGAKYHGKPEFVPDGYIPGMGKR